MKQSFLNNAIVLVAPPNISMLMVIMLREKWHSGYTTTVTNAFDSTEDIITRRVELQTTKNGKLIGKFERPINVSQRSILSQMNNSTTPSLKALC